MNDGNAKQQIVDKIKNSTNILVTVSNDPSVDELSAALGLTLLLNKMDKHATAVFSGAIPPAITFLDPQKTFEDTVNSLRDFIIALDKEKADHLRYKVEGEVVKIFITPYRTTITNEDLEFSQGDYNVELVLALGVKKRDNLDKALEAHGRILHDATVATMSVGQVSELGSIDWHEGNASSLSEMLVSLSDSLKSDKSLLDEQIATAFLTGVVAATDRFSNSRTSPKVMTMAAQLMAAGANQQLIAAKLEDANEITGNHAVADEATTAPTGQAELNHADGTTDLSEGESTKVDRTESATQEPPKTNDGSLAITHEPEELIDQVAIETAKRQQEEAARVAEENLAAQLPPVLPVVTPSVADLDQELAAAAVEVPAVYPEIITKPTPQLRGPVEDHIWKNTDQTPMMGGTLNATAEQAAEDQRKADEADRNRTILTHSNGDYINNDTPSSQAPLNAATMPPEEAPLPDLFASGPAADPVMQYEESAPVSQRTATLADIDEWNRQPHEEARQAVNEAFSAAPFAPSSYADQSNDVSQTQDTAPSQNTPALPPLPDFSTLPPLPPLSDSPMPNGAISPEKLEDMLTPAPQQPTPAPQSNDPAQFKIPGQQ
ncbi:MAG TPA: hypothetical protein VGO98_03315 [Candidatus Saccharimonadales bacterium]|jgi:murein DD-endopeptidase MepM/ murein hydrolase activator NlpD|nr:hypothetical protein [Candidatus Saccharimonadales bacterium]